MGKLTLAQSLVSHLRAIANKYGEIRPLWVWRWWELDVTWWVIWLLKRVGLARKVVMPPQEAIDRSCS